MPNRLSFQTVAVFFGFLLFYLLMNHVLPGPLISPDSQGMMDMAVAPWNHLGDWRPTGLSFILYLSQHLGLGVPILVPILAALRLTALFTLFGTRLPFLPSLGLTFLFLGPSWFMLDSTFWTEGLFITLVIAIGIILSEIKSLRISLALTIVTFTFLCEVRHAALFLLPALMIAIGIRWRRALVPWPRTVAAAMLLPLAWVTLNLVRTGRPFSPSTDLYSCVQGIVSLNPLPYCQWMPDSNLCKLDPNHEFLNNPLKVDVWNLTALHFDPKSPIVQFKHQYGLEKICNEYHTALSASLKQAPLLTANLLVKRVWGLFGQWEITERSRPFSGPKETPAIKQLDDILEIANLFQRPYRILLLACLIALAFPRNRSPLLVLLVVGALGHAAGLAISNPFRVLRYMAIHKIMVELGFVWLVLQNGWQSKALKLFRRSS